MLKYLMKVWKQQKDKGGMEFVGVGVGGQGNTHTHTRLLLQYWKNKIMFQLKKNLKILQFAHGKIIKDNIPYYATFFFFNRCQHRLQCEHIIVIWFHLCLWCDPTAFLNRLCISSKINRINRNQVNKRVCAKDLL